MKRVVIFFALFLLSVQAASVLESEEDVFRTGYICFDLKGNQRWKADTEIARSGDKKPDVYTLIEKGQGRYSGYKGKIVWVAKLEFESKKDSVRPLRMEKHVFDESGKLLAVESQEFDFINKIAIYRYEDLSKKYATEKEFAFKGDVTNRLILGLYIQKFLENGETEKTFYMLNSEPRLYKINVRIIDKEEINTNGSEKTAYKLCLDPQLGLLDMVKLVLPKAYVWHSAIPEFEWLRYTGLESDFSSPKVEIVTLD